MKRYTEDTPVVNVEKGAEFEIELKANPTTGYTWKPVISKAIVKQIGGLRTERMSQAIGGESKEVFLFHALEAGETVIRFSYHREWTPDKEEDSRVFDVFVQ
jgi:predicted secreted protein